MRHRFWFGLSERLLWSRGAFHENPARVLAEGSEQGERIAALQSRYQVKFEARFGRPSALSGVVVEGHRLYRDRHTRSLAPAPGPVVPGNLRPGGLFVMANHGQEEA